MTNNFNKVISTQKQLINEITLLNSSFKNKNSKFLDKKSLGKNINLYEKILKNTNSLEKKLKNEIENYNKEIKNLLLDILEMPLTLKTSPEMVSKSNQTGYEDKLAQNTIEEIPKESLEYYRKVDFSYKNINQVENLDYGIFNVEDIKSEYSQLCYNNDQFDQGVIVYDSAVRFFEKENFATATIQSKKLFFKFF